MDKQNFLVVDTETGGIDSKTNKLLEIAAAVYNSHGEKIDSFHIFLSEEACANKTTSLVALKLNKYRTRTSPLPLETNKEAAIKFSNWILEVSLKHNPILVGHNVDFDIKFIDEFMKENGFIEWNKVFGIHHIDTLMLAKVLQLTQNIKSKYLNLSAVAEELGVINKDAHTAMSDVDTTAKILIRMLNLIKSRGQGLLI